MVNQVKNAVFEEAGRRNRCQIDETVVIAGSPRSGTTWLLELLRTLPGHKALNEPLMYGEARHEQGFSWRTYLNPKEEADEQRAYLKTVLTGQLGISPAWHFEADSRLGQLVEQATRRKLVVKFCRLNRMLHWFIRQFDVRGPVFIVRHPCAVVASMLRHGGWDEEHLNGHRAREIAEPRKGLPMPLRDEFELVLENIETRTEALATMWCLDHYVPLIQHADGVYPWILVPYERMVTQGREELRRVTNALDVQMTPEMRDQLNEPSSSVKDQLHQDAERQLSKWRRRLSDRQVDDVLRIVDDVGLSSIYSDDLEPDYDHLNKFQRPATRW